MFSKTPPKIISGSTDRSPSLPSSLEENKLVTISVAHDGSYKGDQGKQHYLPNAVFRVIETMTMGQKVLILDEKEDRDRGKYREEGNRGKHLVSLLLNCLSCTC
jgi:hypothetical protein